MDMVGLLVDDPIQGPQTWCIRVELLVSRVGIVGLLFRLIVLYECFCYDLAAKLLYVPEASSIKRLQGRDVTECQTFVVDRRNYLLAYTCALSVPRRTTCIFDRNIIRSICIVI